MEPVPQFLRCSLVLLLCAAPLAAQDVQPSAPPPPDPIRLELPLFDAPYNFANGYRAPSMAQSLAAGILFYEASHRAIRSVWGGRVWLTRISTIAWDAFATVLLPLPGSDGWVHEEFHRAVLGNRGFDSFNNVYKFRSGSGAIYVSHVRDEDLVRLKRERPAEHVRLSAAGIEGEYQLVDRLEKQTFFNDPSSWHVPLLWAIKVGSLGYVLSGSWDIVNRETDSLNAIDGPDISVRDFTGHDFTAWVYDLHRPDEPYTARGVHPTGVGIDRYIKPEDLTSAELAYLKRQGRLQILNFADPFLIGRRAFVVRNPFNEQPMWINVRAGHVLTPFGYTIDANVLLQQDRARLVVVLHTYVNDRRTLPGIDVTLLQYPVAAFGRTLVVSPRASLWLQPADQRFNASAARPGGLIGVKVQRCSRWHLNGYVEVEAKTAGWVAGIEHLGPNVAVRMGVSLAVR